MSSIFLELGVIVIIAGLAAYIARTIKQPLIPAYIAAGILLGPILGVITDKVVVEALSDVGIAFLLFTAGLELNLKKLKEVGRPATIGGIAHMVIIFLIGFSLFRLLGFSPITSTYLGLILIFSSTLVVVKLLSDKKELDTLHGRIIVGILLVQDLVAIIVLSILNTAGTSLISSLLAMFAEGILVLTVAYFISKITFERLFKFAARNDELLFILTLTVLFSFALVYSQIGFSVAIGAFIAGLILGQFEYKYEMAGQVKGLKEFFAVIFFVSIGLALEAVNFGVIGLPLAVMLFMLLVVVPLVIMTSLSVLGYKKRTSFLSAISLVQVSEFSLILVRNGLSLGQITQDIFSMTIILALITLTITSYLIKYDEKLYAWLGRRLDFFERLSIMETQNYSYEPDAHKPQVVLVGYDRTGFSILKKLKQIGKPTTVVDINPDVIKKLSHEKIPCIYGDAGDAEIIDRLNIEKVKTVISTIPSHAETRMLIDAVRKRNPSATVIVTGLDADEAVDLYNSGADYVIVPHFLGGEHLSFIIDDLTGSINKRLRIKIAHLKGLQERKKHHLQR